MIGSNHTPSAVLTSADPEPPEGTIVRDDCGTRWVNEGAQYRPACWSRLDVDIHDPEDWAKVAGDYGPVVVTDPLGGRP